MQRKKKTPAAITGAVTAMAMTAGFVLLPPAGATEASASPADPASRVITLITGDQVVLDTSGEVMGVRQAEGREDIPVSLRRSGESVLVIPDDAAPLIAQGTVDRQLFDVTELARPEYDRLADGGLPIIVTYRGDKPAASAQLFAGATPEVRAELKSIDAQALTVADDDTTEVWNALTGPRPLTSGAVNIALDGLNQPSLDESVPQIGVPQAWRAGYDGDGATIAVLDTGIDTGHPDLAGGKVIAAANFSEASDTKDRFGHGTHVASIAAGTGAMSGGRYTGVAPGAGLLIGKVIDDSGYGLDSGIIEGMEWAVEQDAQIVNMSIGSRDEPGVDPLEEAVNRLSAESDALFVIAVGNLGPSESTLGSPGSADAALSVGAVDKSDRLASFSSVGPRLEDGAIKPDITAPGVAIGAAAAEGSLVAEYGEPVADGYVAIGGTSMACPHVAGAAALLAQRHPDWTGKQIRAALVGSTRPGVGLSAFQQGSGRVDVVRAMKQTVIAEPVSLNFGAAQWSHEDDQPLTRDLTYRNLGDKDVTLDLAVSGYAPEGGPAPEGMFSLETEMETVTVPAGSTATVRATADTTLGGDLHGFYTMRVTATGSGLTIHTVGAVNREQEMYGLTIKGIGPDGGPAPE